MVVETVVQIEGQRQNVTCGYFSSLIYIFQSLKSSCMRFRWSCICEDAVEALGDKILIG